MHSLRPKRRAPAWGWRSAVLFSTRTVAVCGQQRTTDGAQRSIALCRASARTQDSLHDREQHGRSLLGCCRQVHSQLRTLHNGLVSANSEDPFSDTQMLPTKPWSAGPSCPTSSLSIDLGERDKEFRYTGCPTDTRDLAAPYFGDLFVSR